jgi:beta-glucanase (GH16 family)
LPARFRCQYTALIMLMQVLFLILGLAGHSPSHDAAVHGRWELVWSDEFDTPGLPDPTKWDYEEGFIRNRELQYYTRSRKENARVQDGMMVIESRKEKFENPRFNSSLKNRDWRMTRKHADYTSASLITKGKASWQYGRFEVRAKLPTGRGTWPAIWTLGSSFDGVNWPECGEIDIMENVGFDPDVIHANVHTPRYNHVLNTHKGSKIIVPKPFEDFHVYAMEWHRDRLDFFVDDRKYFTFQKESDDRDRWPFDEPQYLLMNLAIGGDWGGQKGIDESIFPQRLIVDYVRVYRDRMQPAM